MSLRIYEEQKRYTADPRPYNYLPDDVLYRLPWAMGDPEPPLRVLYPLTYKTADGREVLDPLTIYVGRTASQKPFAYNPRYVVNPLILVVGTPGAGKSLHPDEPVLVVRGNRIEEIPIKQVKPGDKVFSVTEDGKIKLSHVIELIEHEFEGELIHVHFIGGVRGFGTVAVTPDHSLLVYSDNGIEPIRGNEVRESMEVPTLNPEYSMTTAMRGVIIKVHPMKYRGKVYDIATENGTFMLANGLFVHNSATLKTFVYNFIQNELKNERIMPEGRIPPVVIVDPEGEYAIIGKMIGQENMLHLKLGRRDYINIFDRPTKTINPFSWYMRMIAVIQKFLNISPNQAAQAYRVLKRAILDKAKEKGITLDPATWYKPDITLEEIRQWIENQVKTLENKGKMTPGERMFYRGATTLTTRLDQWMVPPNDAFSKRSTVPLNKLFDYKLVVLDARGLGRELFGVFSYWIVYWSYGLMLEKGPLPEFGVRMILVIDEAWALLKKTERREEENPLEALARRGRKYGILIIVGTQTPEDVDEKMFSLFGTLVTGIIPSDKMVKKVVESRGMPKRFNSIIKSLGRGNLVWSINWSVKDFPMSRLPILVKTDYPIKRVIQIS